jgi:hypothetical protein
MVIMNKTKLSCDFPQLSMTYSFPSATTIFWNFPCPDHVPLIFSGVSLNSIICSGPLLVHEIKKSNFKQSDCIRDA